VTGNSSVESMWQKYERAEVDLFASEKMTHCPFWFTLTPQAPLWLDAFPWISLLPMVLARGLPGPSPPSQSMVLEPGFSSRWHSTGDSSSERSSFSMQATISHPKAGDLETLGLPWVSSSYILVSQPRLFILFWVLELLPPGSCMP